MDVCLTTSQVAGEERGPKMTRPTTLLASLPKDLLSIADGPQELGGPESV